MKKNINKKVQGRHYDLDCGVETIRIIEAIVSRERIPRKSAYAIGNAVKYLLRAGIKEGESWEDDVAKAENYLHRSITGAWNEKR